METGKQSYEELSGVNAKTLLSRQLQDYMDIEKCNTSYELRYAIAYEAAIRNEDITNALHDYIQTENADSRTFLRIHGFTDEVILYYRMTHTEEFPPQINDAHAEGLASIDETDSAPAPNPYKLTPLCPKIDAAIINDTPLIQKSDGITKADIDNYSSFSMLLFEPRFIRPKLSPLTAKKFNIELNFELPESELLEYVSQLHKMYHKHNTPGTAELLSDMEFEKEPLTKANTIKYADMLYVYDFKKRFEHMFLTQQELYEKIRMDLAYTISKEDRKMLSNNTVRNYIITMQDIVENHGYLNFLTGIKP